MPRPRIRTEAYWREYKRKKAREWYHAHKELRRRAIDQLKLARGCDACGYREHPAPLAYGYPNWRAGDQLLCANCRAQIGPVLDITTISPQLRAFFEKLLDIDRTETSGGVTNRDYRTNVLL
jgi:hypothetical protein